jgi:hypothetical protein
VVQLGFAPYLEQVVRFSPLEVTLGLRADLLQYGDVASWQAEPRAVTRLEIFPQVWLKAASGLFSQAPLPFQVLREGGNAGLRPNRAFQNSIGAELKLPAALEIDTNLFYNAMWQLTRPDTRP